MAIIDTVGAGSGLLDGPIGNPFTSTVTPPSGGGTASSCANLFYANRSDIELIYGAENVSKWADLDNDEDTRKIDLRICWALNNAHVEINDRLLGGPYVIPFRKINQKPYPRQVIVTCARIAGLQLHDSRGITDFTQDGIPKNQLFNHAQMIKQFFFKILTGTMRLQGYTGINDDDIVFNQNVPGIFNDPPNTTEIPFTF